MSIKHNERRGPTIPHLLTTSSPSAIIWTIASIVVFAVQAVLWCGSFAHVGNEIDELTPSFAYTYAAPAIIMPPGILRIGAPSDHVFPDAVFSRLFLAMLDVSAGRIEPAAPARSCCAKPQIIATNDSLVAALTTAKPSCCFSVGMFGLADDRQLAKLQAYDVFGIAHCKYP